MSGDLGMRRVGRRPGWVLALCFGGMLVQILGCAASPARQDYFYRVEVQSPSSSSGACRLPGTLAVDRFESDVLTDGRQIVYQKDAGSPELGRYAFHLWSNPPSQLLSQQLASYLGKRGVADQVVMAADVLQPSYTVRGRLLRMQHTLAPDAEAVLELQLTLVEDRDRKVLMQKTYSASEPAKSVADAVRAFGSEAEQIFGQFVKDCGSRLGPGVVSGE